MMSRALLRRPHQREVRCVLPGDDHVGVSCEKGALEADGVPCTGGHGRRSRGKEARDPGGLSQEIGAANHKVLANGPLPATFMPGGYERAVPHA